jgi:hypothetical protein
VCNVVTADNMLLSLCQRLHWNVCTSPACCLLADSHTLSFAVVHAPLCCYLQQQLPNDKQSKEQWWYPFAKIGCGAAAGIAAQTASYPLDTLRRRLQVNAGPGTSVRYR